MADDPAAVFEEFAGAERKRVVAVYKRRGRDANAGGAAGKSHQKSWVDRGLSSRRTSTIVDTRRVRGKARGGLQARTQNRQLPPKSCQRKCTAPPTAFVQEKQAHFAEVDAFELQEESPSPKKHPVPDHVLDFPLRARLEAVPEEFSREKENIYLTPDEFLAAALRTPDSRLSTARLRLKQPAAQDHASSAEDISSKLEALHIVREEEPVPHIFKEEEPVTTLAATSTLDALLQESSQASIVSLGDAIFSFCDMKSIVKVGEGTYGEAYKGNGNVFKIVPMDGDSKVNGEPQKTSKEMFSEVLLSNTLNKLRDRTNLNMCTTFVQTKATRICQGRYDENLIKAWEKWDVEHSSENDHPRVFQDKQLYLVFVLEDGGVDLESYSIRNYNEARSIILQTVLTLAVGEQGCGFEHRDLHWGNIVLASKNVEELRFRLQDKDLAVKTLGISVCLIDFTLSRLDTGQQVIFCDMSDPSWFEGTEGDVQADTYRRMRDVTKGEWAGSFPKTNSLWIHYLAEIIRKQKAFRCSPKDKRSLCAFAKRALEYDSATATASDKLFEGLLKEAETELGSIYICEEKRENLGPHRCV